MSRSERAAAFAAILKLHDCQFPVGTQDTLMLKQCKSYVALNCVVVIFMAIKSKPVVALSDIFGVSLILPERPRVCVNLLFVISWPFVYWYDLL